MAVKPANTFFKSFTFNNTVASTYGVYVTDVNVYDAPVRAVEYMTIPGRNGAFALDQGRFDNIQIVYSCAMKQDTFADFADAIDQFRNKLASTKGYCRLTDDFNTSEYRMASFSGGLDVETKNNKHATFDVVFEAKPQRWLTSGETATAVANNGTLTNPTYFDSEPLLAVKGYGNIAFNGYSIDIENVPIGEIIIAEGITYSSPLVLDLSNANTGDDIDVNCGFRFDMRFYNTTPFTSSHVSDSLTDSNSAFTTAFYQKQGGATTSRAHQYVYKTEVQTLTFQKGTSATKSNTISGTSTFKYNGTNYSVTVSVSQSVSYDGTDTLTVTQSGSLTSTMPVSSMGITYASCGIRSIVVDSTKSALGNPTYIDCEIGECYMISGGEVVSLNNAIALGSDLPKLAPGTNTFTYDNTITELKVTPRWWKV